MSCNETLSHTVLHSLGARGAVILPARTRVIILQICSQKRILKKQKETPSLPPPATRSVCPSLLLIKDTYLSPHPLVDITGT
ncbi:hypothetical protein FKM82_003769 [Ascaphus truei]